MPRSRTGAINSSLRGGSGDCASLVMSPPGQNSLQSAQSRAMPDLFLSSMGIAFLVVGAAFYYFTRADPPLVFHWFDIRAFSGPPLLATAAWGWVPSFAHTAAFALLSAAWLPARSASWMLAALFWFAVNAAIEFMQAWSGPLTGMADGARLTRLIADHVASGVFDTGDIAAVGAGAFVAFTVCGAVSRYRSVIYQSALRRSATSIRTAVWATACALLDSGSSGQLARSNVSSTAASRNRLRAP